MSKLHFLVHGEMPDRPEGSGSHPKCAGMSAKCGNEKYSETDMSISDDQRERILIEFQRPDGMIEIATEQRELWRQQQERFEVERRHQQMRFEAEMQRQRQMMTEVQNQFSNRTWVQL